MGSTLDFVTYLCDQLAGVGELRFRKMFGEYMIYVNDKPVVLVCDDTAYVKTLPCLADLLTGYPTAPPYEGAKDHYVLDPDDQNTLREAAIRAEAVTPLPKPKKKGPRAR